MLKRLSIIFIFLLFFLFFIESTQAAIILGNPNGKVTLTFFYDYQCIYCHHTFNELLKVMDAEPHLKVRLVPVALLNPMSLEEAKLALASAHTPYFNALNLILMNQMISSPQEMSHLLSQFQLNTDSFYKKMDNLDIKNELQADRHQLNNLTELRVPLFLINPSKQPLHTVDLKGEQSEITLKKAIDSAMAH